MNDTVDLQDKLFELETAMSVSIYLTADEVIKECIEETEYTEADFCDYLDDVHDWYTLAAIRISPSAALKTNPAEYIRWYKQWVEDNKKNDMEDLRSLIDRLQPDEEDWWDPATYCKIKRVK